VSKVDWPMIAITAVFAALALLALWAAFGHKKGRSRSSSFGSSAWLASVRLVPVFQG
jgi:hypothetical protein